RWRSAVRIRSDTAETDLCRTCWEEPFHEIIRRSQTGAGHTAWSCGRSRGLELALLQPLFKLLQLHEDRFRFKVFLFHWRIAIRNDDAHFGGKQVVCPFLCIVRIEFLDRF